eukprot:1135353-Prymnesium_polylepis.1
MGKGFYSYAQHRYTVRHPMCGRMPHVGIRYEESCSREEATFRHVGDIITSCLTASLRGSS